MLSFVWVYTDENFNKKSCSMCDNPKNRHKIDGISSSQIDSSVQVAQ